jgi:hypothetical protein
MEFNSAFKGLKSDSNGGYFAYAYIIIPLSILLRMRNVSDTVEEKIKNIHFMAHNFFFKSCLL